MVSPSGALAEPSAAYSLDDRILIDDEVHDIVKINDTGKGICLCDGAGETVQDEAVLRVILTEALPYHLDGDFIGNKLTACDDCLNLVSKLTALFLLSPEEISGGDVGD